MAKSIRSKWRRKCRAIKRERYGAKELERLKKTLGIDGNDLDAEMKDISNIANVVTAETVKEQTKNSSNESADTDERMEDDCTKVYNKKTMLDQFGNYPVWMHRRKINKIKKGRAKTKKATVKQSKRLTRRDKKKLKQKSAKTD